MRSRRLKRRRRNYTGGKKSSTVCSVLSDSPHDSGKCLSDQHYAQLSSALGETPSTPDALMDKVGCEDERCAVQKVMEKTQNKSLAALMDVFAPKQSDVWKKNPTEWLTTSDIRQALAPWLQKYREAVLLDITARDWFWKHPTGQCESQSMCDFNLDDYHKRGKHKICVVHNLDSHDGPGTHWVTVYICGNNKHIYYFDSTGRKCPKDIKKFVKKVQAQSGRKYGFTENKVQHQLSNTECGVYSIYFLTHMMKTNGDFSHFKSRVPDAVMKRHRDVFFSSS